MSRTNAIALAAKYGLENEIIYGIDNLGQEPAEALADWDIL